MSKYTIILSYPDNLATDGPEYFTAYEEEATPQDAVDSARREAAGANEYEEFPEDFALVAVIEGHANFVEGCE